MSYEMPSYFVKSHYRPLLTLHRENMNLIPL
jgi:hypothetical protein